jgi:hypothetical protein
MEKNHFSGGKTKEQIQAAVVIIASEHPTKILWEESRLARKRMPFGSRRIDDAITRKGATIQKRWVKQILII